MRFFHDHRLFSLGLREARPCGIRAETPGDAGAKKRSEETSKKVEEIEKTEKRTAVETQTKLRRALLELKMEVDAGELERRVGVIEEMLNLPENQPTLEALAAATHKSIPETRKAITQLIKTPAGEFRGLAERQKMVDSFIQQTMEDASIMTVRGLDQRLNKVVGTLVNNDTVKKMIAKLGIDMTPVELTAMITGFLKTFLAHKLSVGDLKAMDSPRLRQLGQELNYSIAVAAYQKGRETPVEIPDEATKRWNALFVRWSTGARALLRTNPTANVDVPPTIEEALNDSTAKSYTERIAKLLPLPAPTAAPAATPATPSENIVGILDFGATRELTLTRDPRVIVYRGRQVSLRKNESNHCEIKVGTGNWVALQNRSVDATTAVATDVPFTDLKLRAPAAVTDAGFVQVILSSDGSRTINLGYVVDAMLHDADKTRIVFNLDGSIRLA